MSKPDECAHPPCSCPVRAGESFCSDHCREQGSTSTRSSCGCGHADCEGSVQSTLL